jgi:hypothetical protein
MQEKLEKLNKPLPKIYADYYGEDWKTKGDWYGRITTEFAILCAMDAPLNHYVYRAAEYIVRGFIGPNCTKGDSMRHWLHWRRTADRRSLWDVHYAFRRQAEWDDHGEVYPLTKDGPDLWYLVDIRHPGVYQISMYFFNKDGHAGMNRIRDYVIEVYHSPQKWTGVFEDYPKFGILAEKQVTMHQPLVRTRMRDFWGGVHKQFVFKGIGSYFVKIDRNYSFNTILSAVMIEQVHGELNFLQIINKNKGCMFMMEGVPYEPPPFPENINHETGKQIFHLWNLLNDKYDSTGSLKLMKQYRINAFIASNRIAEKEGGELKQLSDSIKWRLNQWDDEQRKEYEETMLRGWKAYFCSEASQQEVIRKNRARFPHIYKEERYDKASYPQFQEKTIEE